jgi:hypothetical protein
MDQLAFEATTSTTTLTSIISDAKLEIDGNTYTDWTYDNTCNGGATTGAVQNGCLVFDLLGNDNQFTIAKDDKVSGKLVIDFNKSGLATNGYVNGDTIEFDVTNGTGLDAFTNLWTYEDIDGATPDSSGSANGEALTLRSEGLFAEIVSTNASVRTINNGIDDVVDYTIKFDVTAFDTTAYVSSVVGTALPVGTSVLVEDNTGTSVLATGASTTVQALSSTATKEGSSFRVDDGDTETFTYTVTLNTDTGETGSFRIQLVNMIWGTTAGTPTGSTLTFAPTEDFQTSYAAISQSDNS